MLKGLFNKKREFKFDENENVSCIVCDHVMNREREILLVTHDMGDGQWGFLCGEEDHNMENYKLISLKEVIEIDNSVNELYEIPLGFGATRGTQEQKWKPFKQEKE